MLTLVLKYDVQLVLMLVMMLVLKYDVQLVVQTVVVDLLVLTLVFHAVTVD